MNYRAVAVRAACYAAVLAVVWAVVVIVFDLGHAAAFLGGAFFGGLTWNVALLREAAKR